MPILSTEKLKSSEDALRRAHHVLAWVMHFYINTLPADAPLVIPRSISIPLLEVSDNLALPPLLTYSDDVLYNWKYRNPNDKTATMPTISNITVQTTFTQTPSEEHFYLTSAYIELRGAVALSLMSLIMDEVFVRDAAAIQQISVYLQHLARIIAELREILLVIRNNCDPEVFYNDIRPWFKGQDSMHGGRRWIFEGVGELGYEHLKPPADGMLHGPSAGQSSLIHALDVFFGVESHGRCPAMRARSVDAKNDGDFLQRMRAYMPRHHRAFLEHLDASPYPLRAFIVRETKSGGNPELLAAYNAAVSALRAFRGAHMRIVAQYIVAPAHRVRTISEDSIKKKEARGGNPREVAEEKGTGGTPAMTFLKGICDRTAEAVL